MSHLFNLLLLGLITTQFSVEFSATFEIGAQFKSFDIYSRSFDICVLLSFFRLSLHLEQENRVLLILFPQNLQIILITTHHH